MGRRSDGPHRIGWSGTNRRIGPPFIIAGNKLELALVSPIDQSMVWYLTTKLYILKFHLDWNTAPWCALESKQISKNQQRQSNQGHYYLRAHTDHHINQTLANLFSSIINAPWHHIDDHVRCIMHRSLFARKRYNACADVATTKYGRSCMMHSSSMWGNEIKTANAIVSTPFQIAGPSWQI